MGFKPKAFVGCMNILWKNIYSKNALKVMNYFSVTIIIIIYCKEVPRVQIFIICSSLFNTNN